MGSDFHGRNKPNKLGQTYICELSDEQKIVFELSCLKTFKNWRDFHVFSFWIYFLFIIIY